MTSELVELLVAQRFEGQPGRSDLGSRLRLISKEYADNFRHLYHDKVKTGRLLNLYIFTAANWQGVKTDEAIQEYADELYQWMLPPGYVGLSFTCYNEERSRWDQRPLWHEKMFSHLKLPKYVVQGGSLQTASNRAQGPYAYGNHRQRGVVKKKRVENATWTG